MHSSRTSRFHSGPLALLALLALLRFVLVPWHLAQETHAVTPDSPHGVNHALQHALDDPYPETHEHGDEPHSDLDHEPYLRLDSSLPDVPPAPAIVVAAPPAANPSTPIRMAPPSPGTHPPSADHAAPQAPRGPPRA